MTQSARGNGLAQPPISSTRAVSGTRSRMRLALASSTDRRVTAARRWRRGAGVPQWPHAYGGGRGRRRGRRAAVTLPNFLIVGAGKAGTPSLAAWLAAHPDVYVPPIKEVEFFNHPWH